MSHLLHLAFRLASANCCRGTSMLLSKHCKGCKGCVRPSTLFEFSDNLLPATVEEQACFYQSLAELVSRLSRLVFGQASASNCRRTSMLLSKPCGGCVPPSTLFWFSDKLLPATVEEQACFYQSIVKVVKVVSGLPHYFSFQTIFCQLLQKNKHAFIKAL